MRFLLGVSGGIDSMCMASLFHASRLNPEFAVAHVNFALRGEDSDKDEAFVRDWAAANGIRFFSTHFDTASYASDKGISIEMAARELRYEWFDMLRKEQGFDRIAVAHNMNDAAETMYLNLLRGTGIRGIAGMKEVNGAVVRPLLQFSREQIEGHSRKNGIEFRTDVTNGDTTISRNRIRNEVFPHFAMINPSFIETAAREIEHFAEIESVLDGLLEQKKNELVAYESDVFCIDIERLSAEPHMHYWLFRLLQPFGFNEDTVARITSAMDGQSGKTFYSPGHKAVRDRKYLKIYPLDNSGPAQVDISIFDIPAGFNPRTDGSGTLYIDADKVRFPLRSRGWLPADRFRPFGMKGTRKLSDFFSDLKLDVEQKQRQTVVTTVDENGREQIVCIAGLRIDDRYRISADTKRIAAISCRVQK